MKQLFICILLLNISEMSRAQFINDHIDISKAVTRFKDNKHLKIYTLKNVAWDSIQSNFKFVYDSTNNELFKVFENYSAGSKQNEYAFSNEQLYSSKTERGTNYFFMTDYNYQNPVRRSDQALYKIREHIKAKAYSFILFFRNYVVASQ